MHRDFESVFRPIQQCRRRHDDRRGVDVLVSGLSSVCRHLNSSLLLSDLATKIAGPRGGHSCTTAAAASRRLISRVNEFNSVKRWNARKRSGLVASLLASSFVVQNKPFILENTRIDCVLSRI